MSFFNPPNLISIKSITTTSPPGSPNLVDVYVVPSGATGAWSGQTDKFTRYNGSSWDFIAPFADSLVWTVDSATFYQYSGSTWVIPSASASGASQPFADNLSLVKNNSDNTKQLIISASNITTGTTRTFNVPDANTTLVGIDTTQTLTNKTINASNNTLSNITEAMLSFSDITTLNSSTGQHGFLKKLSGSATDYMDGSGNWSTPSGSGTVLPVIDTQTIVKGSVDATKLLRFEVDGFTTGVTRVATWIDSDLTVVGEATTQTLTNKTINASNNTLSNITEAMLSFSDVTTLNSTTSQHGFLRKLSGTSTQFLDGSGNWSVPAGTGASLPAADNTDIIKNNTDNTKLLRFDLGGLTTATTRTLTVPDASGTITLIAATQTFTNKTLTSSTNVLGGVTLTLGSDATGDIYYRNSGGVFTRLGIGTTNQVLTVISGLPSWQTPSGGGGTAWSAITDPSGNLSLAMSSNTTTFTWAGNYTGSAFKLAGSNTSPTGALVEFSSGVSNNMSVLKLTPRGGRSFEADKLGSLLLGKDSPGSTDTDGYAYFGVIGSNSHPTGTPTSNTGFAPITIASDGINDIRTIWMYAGSKWNDIGGVYKRYDTGSGSGTQSINFNSSSSAHVTREFTLTGTTTFTFDNPPKAGTCITVTVIQDSTGSRTLSWPSTVKWSGGTAPTLTTTGNKRDSFTFYWNGSNYYNIAQSLNL